MRVKKKIVTFGEIMLRLSPPERERLFQSPSFRATFGGSEANVAASLAMFGCESVFVTALPSNDLGKAAARFLSSFGVSVRAAFAEGRLGIYFSETGACQRPSKVIYDREGSRAAVASAGDYGFESALEGASWFHVSGVTPAISRAAADSALFAMKTARGMGVPVSFDLNYRAKLWRYGAGNVEVMRELAASADVIIANEEDIQKNLGIALEKRASPVESYKALCAKVKDEFPRARRVAVTLRDSVSADVNGWSAVMDGERGFLESREYEIVGIVDRLGAGDSFAAGLIYGLLNFEGDEKKALDFAAAASCLKHSVHGDFNIVTKDEVEFLMNGDESGRIQR